MEKPCLCYYPCNNSNCPKKPETICHTNYCDAVSEFARLNKTGNNYCAKCGRKLN